MFLFFVAGLVGLSFAGYVNAMVNKMGLSVFVAPVTLVTAICAVLFLAGLLNIMPLCTYMVILLGWILLIKYRKSFAVSCILDNWFALILCGVLLLYLIYYTAGGVFKDGDTMTHWGIIVKSMYQKGGLPSFENPEISYQSYPPGTACWIWFVVKLFGYSDAKAMFAQGFWMYSCVISLFALNKSRSKVGNLLIALSGLYFLKGLDELRVDVILALVTVAAMVIIAQEHNDLRRMTLLLIPFMIVLPMIKNSGLLFALFVFGLALLAAYHKDGKTKGFIGIGALCTVAAWYLWQAHISMVYSGANEKRHSMSLGYMQKVFGEKTIEDIQMIIKAFLSEWFSNNKSFEWEILIVFLVISIAAIILSDRKREAKVLAVAGLGYYLIYKAGMLGMYLFNMPGEDALRVASYYRYQTTYTIIMASMAIYLYFEHIASGTKNKRSQIGKWAGVLLLAVTFGSLIYKESGSLVRPDYKNGGIHRKLTSLMLETPDLDSGDKVLVYHSYQFARYFVQFATDNRECKSTADNDVVAEVLTVNSKDYEWLIILEKDAQIEACLENNGYSKDTSMIKLVSD